MFRLKQLNFPGDAGLSHKFGIGLHSVLQSLYFRNSKFDASSHLLWLHSPVSDEPGQKPQRPGFLATKLICNENTH